ncbi:MAG: class I SAM-dependent methyltransferase [Chlorobium sp.]
MESVACPISNSTEFTPWLEVPDRFDGSGEVRWQLVKSSVSGLVMLNPRPDSSEIASHYPLSGYDPYLSKRSAVTLRERALMAARLLLLHYRAHLVLKDVQRPYGELTILEIGASTGELLNVFRRKGVPAKNLYGVEPHAPSARYAMEHGQLHLSPSLPESYPVKFDRIVLWHTLEHLHALHETLDAVARLLKPDGRLVITLPNLSCRGARLYCEHWVAWDAPRHLYHFLPDTLSMLLEMHGLTIVRQQPYAPDALYNTLSSEELAAKAYGRPFGAWHQAKALCRGVVECCRGVVNPDEAEGIIYCITLRPNAFSRRVVATRLS